MRIIDLYTPPRMYWTPAERFSALCQRYDPKDQPEDLMKWAVDVIRRERKRRYSMGLPVILDPCMPPNALYVISTSGPERPREQAAHA